MQAAQNFFLSCTRDSSSWMEKGGDFLLTPLRVAAGRNEHVRALDRKWIVPQDGSDQRHR
jgi:hypothetical protein